MPLSERQEQMCSESQWDFSDLNAMFLNCTLKKSPELSHTQGLIDISIAIMEKNRISVECLRPVDYDIASGVWPDMTEHGWDSDQWPEISKKVMAAEILVIGSSIWLGEKTSVCTKTIERLYATSHLLNEHGQYAYYGRLRRSPHTVTRSVSEGLKEQRRSRRSVPPRLRFGLLQASARHTRLDRAPGGAAAPLRTVLDCIREGGIARRRSRPA